MQGRWQSRFLDFRADPDLGLQPVTISNYVAVNAHIAYRLTDNMTLGLTATQFNSPHLLQAGAPTVQRRFFATVSAHF